MPKRDKARRISKELAAKYKEEGFTNIYSYSKAQLLPLISLSSDISSKSVIKRSFLTLTTQYYKLESIGFTKKIYTLLTSSFPTFKGKEEFAQFLYKKCNGNLPYKRLNRFLAKLHASQKRGKIKFLNKQLKKYQDKKDKEEQKNKLNEEIKELKEKLGMFYIYIYIYMCYIYIIIYIYIIE